MDTQARVRKLTTTFLETHGRRIVEELSERLKQSESTALLPIHRALLDLATAYVRKPSRRRVIGAVHKTLAGADSRPDVQSLISGQIALWSVLHRMLREVEGPHKFMDVIHAALALAGDTVDGVIGVLIDIAATEATDENQKQQRMGRGGGGASVTGGRASVASVAWGTSVELGRTHREFQMLHQIIHDLLNAHDPLRMFEILEQGILSTFHLRSLLIAAVNHEEEFVEVVRAYSAFPDTRGPVGLRYDLSYPDILCDVARTGRTEVIDGWDPRYHDRVVQADGSVIFCQPPRDYNAGQTAFFVPILARGRTIGVICTGSTQASKQMILREIERMHPFLHQVGATLSNVSEIIERRRAEEALREGEERFRNLIEQTNDIVWEVDKNGVYTYCSPQVRDILGYEPDEMLGKTPFDFMSLEEARRTREIFARIATVQKPFTSLEHKCICKGGRQVVIECSGAPTFDSSGRFQGYRGIDRDITERRRAEEALKQSEERYRAVVRQSADCIFLVDLETRRILEANPALQRLVGYAPDEILELTLYDLIAHERESIDRNIQRTLTEHHHSIGERRYRRKDGSLVDVEVSVNLISYGGRKVSCVVARDITERKQLEEQLRQAQKMEAVGQLAGGVAHDFNNRLQVVTGYSELLLARLAQDDPMRKEIEDIKLAGERAASLTRQLLAFSRRQVLAPKMLDLNAVVSNMSETLRRLIGEDVNLVTILRPGLGRVKADPGQIEQVVVNLVVNACDAMPQGGRLTIETENVDLDEAYAREHLDARPGPYVMLAVTDTGSGMDAETRSHLFEPFFTTKEQGKGTGMGLAAVYGIVTQSGGSISVSSGPGQGSTFRVYLPWAGEAVETDVSRKPPVGLPQGTETVLLVEDEEVVRDLVYEILRRCGYTVLEAADGAEALQVSERHKSPIHLMVTDVMMPRMNGRELAGRLAPLRPNMKVLYMSGYTEGEVVRHGILESDMAFLPKPFKADALARKVREVIDE